MQLLNDKVDGAGDATGVLPAAEWNQVPSELQNIITALGMTLSNGDLNQLGKALSGYAASGSFFTDSGAANAYVLTAVGGKQVHPDYEDGDEVEFIAANPNTSASTVNVAGKGVKNIKLSDGTNPLLNDISGRTSLKFDSGNDWFELILGPETMTGGLASIRAVGNTDSENKKLNFDFLNGNTRGIVGYDGATDVLSLKNKVHGGNLELEGENVGGTIVPFIVCDPDANNGVAVYDKGVEVARTLPASLGGFEANNTDTGGGFERVLTVSDLGVSGGAKTQFYGVTTADIDYTNDAASSPFLSTVLSSTSSGDQFSGRLVLFGAAAASGTNPGLRLIVDPSGSISAGSGLITTHESLTGDVIAKKAVPNTETTAIPLGLTVNETLIVYEHHFSPTSNSQTVNMSAAQSVSSASFSRVLEGAKWKLEDFG